MGVIKYMPKPVIILGAGASYDYIHRGDSNLPLNHEPPLANNLFDKRFEGIIKHFPQVMNLSASVASASRQGKGLEELFTEIQAKSSQNPERLQQLIACQFYLQKLFRDITSNYGSQSQNNYSELINQIRDNGGQACVVNFNYDLLFEQATGYKLENVGDFVAHPIKIIKVHGAYNWTKVLRNAFRIPSDGDTYGFLMNNPEHLLKNPSEDTDPIYIQDGYGMTDGSGDKYFFYPWIAIPIADKNTFVCPPDHLVVLKEALRQTDRILIVGWKAADQHLVKLMGDVVQQAVKIIIVSGSGKTAREIQAKLSGVINATFPNSVATFSDFVGSQICQEFFQTE